MAFNHELLASKLWAIMSSCGSRFQRSGKESKETLEI